MDEATVRRLYNADHARCLAWFEDHAGESTPFPKPIGDDLQLVTQFKGIYKPRWMPYVLSVRIVPRSPYTDSTITTGTDRNWSFKYSQEEDRRYPPERLFTNIALMSCIEDRIPVGVLYKEHESMPYSVLGLAVPVKREEGYFFFESYNTERTPVIVPDGNTRLVALRAAFQDRVESVTTEEVLDAVLTLRVQEGADGRAKRHQPLTLLWAIGRASQGAGRLAGWPVARAKIDELIREFGHATDRSNAYLPFLALAGTDLWELTAAPPTGAESSGRRRWLNNANPVVKGGLRQPVYNLMAESDDASAEVVAVLLDTYFDDATPADLLRLLQATGLKELVGGKYSEIVWLPMSSIASTRTNADRLTGLPNTYGG